MITRETPFLDTNVLLRHLLADHPDHSPRASNLIAMIEKGERRAVTSELVIFETVFTLARTYKQPPAYVREAIHAILDLPGLQVPRKGQLRRALDLHVDVRLSFADAYHVALMERQGLSQILSFDRDFDRVPDIERLEP